MACHRRAGGMPQCCSAAAACACVDARCCRRSLGRWAPMAGQRRPGCALFGGDAWASARRSSGSCGSRRAHPGQADASWGMMRACALAGGADTRALLPPSHARRAAQLRSWAAEMRTMRRTTAGSWNERCGSGSGGGGGADPHDCMHPCIRQHSPAPCCARPPARLQSRTASPASPPLLAGWCVTYEAGSAGGPGGGASRPRRSARCREWAKE